MLISSCSKDGGESSRLIKLTAGCSVSSAGGGQCLPPGENTGTPGWVTDLGFIVKVITYSLRGFISVKIQLDGCCIQNEEKRNILIMFKAGWIIYGTNFVMLIQDGGEHSRHVLFRRRKAVPSPEGEYNDSWLGYRSRLYRKSHYIKFMWVYYFKSPIKWVLHTE